MKTMTMQDAFDKAIVNKENLNADGSINWNFVDADVYMDANGDNIENYQDKFETMASELSGVYSEFAEEGLLQ
jgi:phosphopentomutase